MSWIKYIYFLLFVVVTTTFCRRQSFGNIHNDIEEEEESEIEAISSNEVVEEDYDDSKVTSNRESSLLNRNIDVKTIVKNYDFATSYGIKPFESEVLVYVTPWNNKGYRNAKKLAHSLDWLSPVWLRVANSQNNQPSILGLDVIDKTWLNEIRNEQSCIGTTANDEKVCKLSHKVRIVPRLSLEVALKDKKDIQKIVQNLINLKNQYKFDGYTLELPLDQWEVSIELTSTLRQKCPECSIIFVLPPLVLSASDHESRRALIGLGELVDRFSVMTYDKNRMISKPAAPLDWVKDVITSLSMTEDINGVSRSLKSKLLLGIPLFGWKGQDAVTADNLIDWMRKPENQVTIQWDESCSEHRFSSKKQNSAVYFPTPLFIKLRRQLAEDLGVAGVAFWELGQTWEASLPLLA